MLFGFLLFEAARIPLGIGGDHLPFSGDMTAWTLFRTIVLTQAWSSVRLGSWNGPSWSISCELLAYLVFAGLVYATRFRRTKTVRESVGAAGFVVLALACYFWLGRNYAGLDDLVFGWATLRALAGFGIGVSVYLIASGSLVGAVAGGVPTATVTAIQFVVLLLLIATLQFFAAMPMGLNVTLMVTEFALLIFLVSLNRGIVTQVLEWAPIQFLGRTSYSIYMIHMLILLILVAVMKRTPALGFHQGPGIAQRLGVSPFAGIALAFGVLALVLVAARFTYDFVEAPWRERGRRWVRSAKNLQM